MGATRSSRSSPWEGAARSSTPRRPTAPSRIEWFDLPPERRQFERYRRLLKRLKKLDKAALHDVVSRPGALRGVAHPPEGAARPRPGAGELLAAHGYAARSAEV